MIDNEFKIKRGTKVSYMALPAVRDLAIFPKRHVSSRYIEYLVSKYFKVGVIEMKGMCRKRELVVPRQAAMYFMRKYTNLTLIQISSRMGGRDHTTAIHGIKTITGLIKHDEITRRQIDDIESKILG